MLFQHSQNQASVSGRETAKNGPKPPAGAAVLALLRRLVPLVQETGNGSSDDNARAKVTVSGRVQGVGFRGFARRHALALGLRGWVRNRYDGAVELVAEGERHKMLRYIALLREGPPWARVDDVQVEWQEHRGEFVSFGVRG